MKVPLMCSQWIQGNPITIAGIRSLQTILLKVSLILGIEIHMGVSYKDIQEPQDSSEGWGIIMDPSDHPVTKKTFDAVIGCEGTKYCLKGFDRKEFRGKLALAITANFVNRNTEAEAAVEEISGVAFIFNQKFFKDLKAEMDIELENIVYYKDDTHYFVMTAKKDSLLRKGVILQVIALVVCCVGGCVDHRRCCSFIM